MSHLILGVPKDCDECGGVLLVSWAASSGKQCERQLETQMTVNEANVNYSHEVFARGDIS